MQAYISKYNHEHSNQVILLMITNDNENQHYLAVKGFSKLLKGITSNHDGDFYCLNCFHSYRTNNKLKKHKKACKDHDYCCVKMPKEDERRSKYNLGEKFIKISVYSLCRLRVFA